jgi:hypothetical protein
MLVSYTEEAPFRTHQWKASSPEGLQSIYEDDDMRSARVRELVEWNSVCDTADSVCRALGAEHKKLFPTTSNSNNHAAYGDVPDVLCGTSSTGPVLWKERLALPPSSYWNSDLNPGLEQDGEHRPQSPEQAPLFSLS